LVPVTEMLPLASVCTPGCEVKVESGLGEPVPRAVTAIGRSTNSRRVFVSEIFDTSVLMTRAASAVTLTVSAWLAVSAGLKGNQFGRFGVSQERG